MGNFFSDLFEIAQGILIPIPLDNPLGIAYVIFNLILLISVAAYGSTGGFSSGTPSL